MRNKIKYKSIALLLGLLISSSLIAQRIDFKLLKFGQNCIHKVAENYIVQNKNDLRDLEIGQIDSVNFRDEILIAVFRGGCASGGYGIYIKEIWKDNKGLNVEVIHTDPGDNCRRLMELTQPFAIYSIKKTELPISFNTSKIIKDCIK